MSEKNIVICSNCGAEFDMHEAKCPFCGHINPLGAEEKYMQQMQDIKSNLAQVDDQQIDTIKRESKKVWKIVLITLAVIVGLIVVLFLSFSFYVKKQTNDYDGLKLYESDPIKAAQWNDTHVADMEAMYEAGDIDGLVDYYENLVANNDLGAFNSWEHSFLITQIYDLRFWTKYLDADNLDSLTIHQVMFNVLYYYNGDYKGTTMPEEDYEYIMDEVQIHIQKAAKRFKISESDIDKMRDECVTESGYINPTLVSEYCDAHTDIFK